MDLCAVDVSANNPLDVAGLNPIRALGFVARAAGAIR